jgi:hypothetical protein
MKDEMSQACSSLEMYKKCTQNLRDNLKEIDPLGDLDVDGKIIFNCSLMN